MPRGLSAHLLLVDTSTELRGRRPFFSPALLGRIATHLYLNRIPLAHGIPLQTKEQVLPAREEMCEK